MALPTRPLQAKVAVFGLSSPLEVGAAQAPLLADALAARLRGHGCEVVALGSVDTPDKAAAAGRLCAEQHVDALAAVSVGLELGVPFEKVKAGIDKFTGVYRRWEKKGEADGIVVYDDYAHHPTECKATLSGVKAGWRKRVVCVFQPHLYSRTRDFYEEFGKAFLLADVLVVTDVYPAREEPIQGVTGELIVSAAKQFGHKEALYVRDKSQVVHALREITRPGDIVITMGAGDIWKYGEQFLKSIGDAS